jgi:hypothetical protein
MKNLPGNILAIVFLLLASAAIDLSAQSTSYEILFDGNSLEKWQPKNNPSMPVKGWKIQDGMLFMEGKGGDIITKEKYGDFELIFEFNLTISANSGIKYFVDTLYNEKNGKMMINGPEYQIIDDYNYKGVKDNPNGTSSTGAAYLFYPPKNKKLNPHGQWNKGKIVAKGKKVSHWLNGKKIVSYVRGNKDYLEKKNANKFKNDKNYGELKEGHILITDHGDKVYFRNIKIKRL